MQPRSPSPRAPVPPPAGPPRDLLAANVEAYIAGDRRRALADGTPMPDRVSGTAIFADISGFTPLTEALAGELGAQRGAEELTAVLNSVFDAVLGELHTYGGSVIYFSGDAVTCWLDGDDGLIGVACGLAMQEAMHRVEDITTPGGSRVKLGMKVAVAAAARRFVVGDPDIQLIDVLAGSLMDRLAAAEHHADKGEVVVDAPTLEVLGARVELAVVRGHGAERVGVVGALAGPAPVVAAPGAYPRLPRAVVRQWLLPPVWERMRSGRGEFLSELRPAVPMFVRFGGIDYDNDADAHLLLDHFVRLAQQVIDSYGGNVLQLTIGDKGAYLHAVFGAPLAHEDDAARACAAALDVLGLEAGTAVTGLQIGVVYGRLRSGAYGHWHRRAFSCLGDAVNLAARLMSAAPPGQIYVGALVAQSAGDSFVFEELADIQVKGKAAPVVVRRLIGRRQDALHRQRRQAHPLVGRQRELGDLMLLGERARSGQGQLVAVVAEAGMGKSRLVEEALGRLGQLGMPAYSGAAASVGLATSYLAWQSVWRALLGLNSDEPLVPQLERDLAEVGPSLLPRLPLFGAVLGTVIEDNDLTRSFDAKLRKTSLESLLLSYFTVRAKDRPMVVLLEDCHWLDPLSADLLEVLARATASLPVLFVLTYRPGNFAAPRLRHSTVMELDKLDPDSCRQLVTARLEELYGPEMAPPAALLQRLADRAEGNPFYLEELVNYLRAEGADLADPAVAASVELPVSLATLVLSRIDTLAERPRRTLKVASVVGREFGVEMLTGAYPDLGAKRQVTGHLRRLCAYDLVVHEEGPVDGYAFKHAVVREVAYDSLPFALRGRLHGRIGTWLETSDPDALDLLAHHFWLSPDEAKKRQYLLRAGDAAQGRYANDAAVDYFRRALSLLDDQARGPVLLKLGAVLELKGDWGDAEAVYGQAIDLARDRDDPVAVATGRAARADPVRKQGRFDEAVAELEQAATIFEAAGNDAGLGRVWHLRGTIAAQRGSYAEAREQYERSRAIRVALGDGPGEASLLSNLAIVAEYEEDYDRAQELNEQAFALRSRLGDRWGIGVSRNNAGMVAYLRGDYVAARALLEEARQLELEVGDLWMVAIANHNLGNATRELGETAKARVHYAEALATYGMTGDRWAQCLLLEDVAILATTEDPPAALRLLGAAEAMREAIGSPRVPAQEVELQERLRPVRAALGDAAAREQAAGHKLDGDAALQLATQLCSPGPVAS